MPAPIIIGLTGAARAGKTTVAEHLRARHGFTIVSYADPLKQMIKTLDPIIGVDEDSQYAEYSEPVSFPRYLSDFLDTEGRFREDTPEDWVKENYPEYRRLLQTLGTECIRAVDQHFWRDRALYQVDTLIGRHPDTARIVIPDVRFPNEAAFTHYYADCTTRLVRVHRPGTDAGTHPSELHTGALGETLTLVNDGSLADLCDLVDGYLEGLTA